MKLRIDRLTKRFGEKTAVDCVSTCMTPGVYGLLGANGAGKTTLMRMLCDVLRPTSGRLLLDGRDVRDLGEEYRSLLGYLPQGFGYYPEFTAMDFMLYLASLKGLGRSESKLQCEELLETVGLSDVSNERIRTFSGGMRQRLGIAQAMINNPSVIVLDEPTAGLDPKERIKFRNLISNLSQGKIVLLSTHIVSDVEHIAEQILIMRGGKFVMSGTVEELTSHMDGKVWELTVDAREAESLAEKTCVSNIRYVDSGAAVVRLVGERPPMPDARSAKGTLEDLYLHVFSDQLSSYRMPEEGELHA